MGLCRHLALEEFVLGVQDFIPRNSLCVFSSQMLAVVVNTVAREQMESLMQYITFGPNVTQEIETWMHQTVEQMSAEDRALLLVFVTGRSWIPEHEDFNLVVRCVSSN